MNSRTGHYLPLVHVAQDISAVVPAELKVICQWITWQAGAVKPDGKFDKLPRGRDGTGTGWQNPEQWMTFDEALAAARRRGHSGVGLVLPAQTADGKHVVALDFDSVDIANTDSPRMQEIQDIWERLGRPYIETSPSGKGLRLFVCSDHILPQISVPNVHGGKEELFAGSAKWVTVTGHSDCGSGVPDATVQIAVLAREWQARLPKHRQQAVVAGDRATGPLDHLARGWRGWPDHRLRDGDGREEYMLAYAGHLRGKGLSQADIERQCLEANRTRYEEPLDEAIVIDRAQRYQTEPASEPAEEQGSVLEQVDQTDAGNVARLWELTQGDFRYVHEVGVWIFWNGRYWQYDRSRSALHKATLRVAATYERKAKRLEKDIDDSSISNDQRKALKTALKSLQAWMKRCRNRDRLDALISLAQKDPRFVLSATELDRDPQLMGVANGVVCLRSGVLRPDSKKDYILRRSPVAFNPAASTALMQKFVDEVTSCPDGIENGKVKPRLRPALARHLQKVGGYCLTGSTREQVMFMLSGKGANGKSLWVDLLKEVAGDYCETVQPEILLQTKSSNGAEQASPSTRKLAGARCAITSESKDGALLDVAVIKRHTGDGTMTARGMYESPITFAVTHKLLLLTNHPPRVDHMDDALRGRIQAIPCDMQWNRPGTTDPNPTLPDADKGLSAKLKAEAEGVLLFFVQGAVAYFKEGLAPPLEVASLTQGYIAAQDTVRRWFTEECVPCGDEEGCTAAQLHASYRAFCSVEGEREQADSPAALGRRLKQMGYLSRKTRDGARYPLKPKDGPGPLDFTVTASVGGSAPGYVTV